jgi:hypothetical protein
MRNSRSRAFFAFSFLVLSVIGASVLVNAESSTKKPSSTKAKTASVREFIAVFLESAPQDHQFPKSIGAFAGFPEGAVTKVDGIAGEESADGKDRTCTLILEASDDGKPAPVCLIVSSKQKTKSETKSHYFRISLEGKLERAFTVSGKVREGKPVKGTGGHEALDISSKEVLALMKKELDFWMKKYSKPAASR